MIETLERFLFEHKDHNSMVSELVELEEKQLEKLLVCCDLALVEKEMSGSKAKEYYIDFENTYTMFDEELIEERIMELRKSKNRSDRQEMVYLERWYEMKKKKGEF